MPRTCTVYQLSADVSALGRTYPTQLSCLGDLKISLQHLLPIISTKVSAHAGAVKQIHIAASTERNARVADLERKREAQMQIEGISPFMAVAEVLRVAGSEIAVVDEAPATMVHARAVLEKWPVKKYFFMRSAILGWGMPAAIGVSLGLNKEPVLALLGDGSALYSPQALWSAARYKVPVTFVIMNNSEYNILRKYALAQGYGANRDIPGLEIKDPAIDFMALAAAMGVGSCLVTRAEDIALAVRAGIASQLPNLVEIRIGTE